jgi:hypothetical protein
MAVYEPPNNYFNNINYNTDFYQVPNDELNGISAAYANSHYLQISQGTKPKSQAISTYFNGGVSIGYSNNPDYTASAGYLACRNILTQFNISGDSIFAANNFYEGNTLLSNKYQANLLMNRFAITRSYPPASMTGPTSFISSGGYGSGIYYSSSSTTNGTNSNWEAFKFPYVSNTDYWQSAANYTNSTGVYTGATTTTVITASGGVTSNVVGEWLQIQMPVSLSVKNYTITALTSSLNTTGPADWVLAGSVNGTVWYSLDVRTGYQFAWGAVTNTTNTFNINVPTFAADMYNYFRIIIQKTAGATTTAIQQLYMNLYDATNPVTTGVSTYNLTIGGLPEIPSGVTLYNSNGNTQLMNSVGFGTTPNNFYTFDVRTVNGAKIQSANANCGFMTLTGGSTATTSGAVNFFDSAGASYGSINAVSSNINITTAGAGNSINFNIGGGNLIGAVNNNGLQLPLTKGIGVGTAAPAYSSVDVFGVSSPLINVNGSNCRIGLNNDNIRLAYVTNAGVYSTGSLVNDFVLLNANGRILFNPNGAPYAHCLMTTSGVGITNFYNTATGTSNASINGDGVITCVSITANSATVKNSLTLAGGTPLTLITAINASAGTQVSNYVTVVPTGYLLWGGGNNSTVTSFSASAGTSYSIRGDYAIIGGGFISYSDKRIKRDIKPIENSLEIIEKIEPKNYNIIETAENRYGFIAQEVEEVIPSAVNLAHDFIPNIFDYGTYDDKIITFDNKNNLDIVEGDEVKINYESCRVEEVIDKNTFRIHKKLEVDEAKKVFIIGTKVKDFKCMNYDMITSINTAAIKELYSIIKQQQADLVIAQQQIAFLMTKIGMV